MDVWGIAVLANFRGSGGFEADELVFDLTFLFIKFGEEWVGAECKFLALF